MVAVTGWPSWGVVLNGVVCQLVAAAVEDQCMDRLCTWAAPQDALHGVAVRTQMCNAAAVEQGPGIARGKNLEPGGHILEEHSCSGHPGAAGLISLLILNWTALEAGSADTGPSLMLGWEQGHLVEAALLRPEHEAEHGGDGQQQAGVAGDQQEGVLAEGQGGAC